MPMIFKTASVPDMNPTETIFNTVHNMAVATAKTIGADCITVNDSDVFKQYFVTTDVIGFPGFGILFEADKGDASTDGDNTYRFGIFNTLPGTNLPDTAEGSLNITTVFKGQFIENTLWYCPETCVMIFDESKDTVLLDIHPGATLHGTDLNGFDDNSSRRSRISFTAFFAKDTNEGVLCGIGDGHITSLRTIDSKIDQEEVSVPQKDTSNSNALHLTKMINYLDPSYPEMKSAYISVIRPIETERDKMYVSTLYADGKRWGRTGLINSWPKQNEYNTVGYPSSTAFFPIEPYVNY